MAVAVAMAVVVVVVPVVVPVTVVRAMPVERVVVVVVVMMVVVVVVVLVVVRRVAALPKRREEHAILVHPPPHQHPILIVRVLQRQALRVAHHLPQAGHAQEHDHDQRRQHAPLQQVHREARQPPP